MKLNKKNKFFYVSACMLLICFLIITSSFNTLLSQALAEEENSYYGKNLFNFSSWVWCTSEVVSTESSLESRNPTVFVDSANNIHVAWQD
jgi:hypothetical protein